MSSYHKAKYYRSVDGCCICRVKSSSSRFTDSYKYENEFERCFLLDEDRGGEICNACVLIVKRWRDLPVTTTKNWNHVVDSRVGPGHNARKVMVPVVMKSTNGGKKRPREDDTEKFDKIMKKRRVVNTRGVERNIVEEKVRRKRKDPSTVRRIQCGDPSPRVIDIDYWRSRMDCCSHVFIRHVGWILRDDSRFSACPLHQNSSTSTSSASTSSPPSSSSTSPMSPLLDTLKVTDSLFSPEANGDIDSGKSFIDDEEDDEDTDSISFYSDCSDSSTVEKSGKNLSVHTDDEGFYDNRLKKTILDLRYRVK